MELTPLSNELLSDVSVEELELRLEMALVVVPLQSDHAALPCGSCNKCSTCNNGQAC